MEHRQPYMTVTKSDFAALRPNMEWRFFPTLEEQNEHFARYMVDRLRAATSRGERLVVVLPTGPIDYLPFVGQVNDEGVSMEPLQVFMMDEYCRDEQTLIDEDHPLSFRRFIRNLLLQSVREDLRMDAGDLVFPDPSDLQCFRDRISEAGSIDVVFAGFGLTGHMAFNDPPEDEEECTVENVRDSTTRVVRLAPETVAQNALGGTRGLLELVPPLAVTIGMREMLDAKEVHLYLLRRWHSGVFRRCLFGPVTPRVPGSFLQEHQAVRVHMPEYVAETPEVIVTLDV